jgi:hypothetical protein
MRHGRGLRETATILRYIASHTRGCRMCRTRLPALTSRFTALADGRGGLPALSGRDTCHHLDGVAQLIRSTVDTFDAEVRLHLAGRCSVAD